MHDWEKLRSRRDVIRFEARAELDWHKSLPRANPYGITMGRGEGKGGERDDNEIRTVLSLCSVDEDEVDQKNPPTLLGQRFLSIVKKKGERGEKGKRKKEKEKGKGGKK